jgi:hypothetical protein
MRRRLGSAARSCLVAALGFVLACQGPRWRAADPANPDQQVCAVGSVRVISKYGDGTIVLTLAPEGDGRKLLATGQEMLPCGFAPEGKDVFTELLAKVELGMRVEVCGYFVADMRNGGSHAIHATSLDRFPGQ